MPAVARFTRAVAAGAAIALSLAGGARAATPFVLDADGDTPSVAVDAAGTGHFAWLSEPSGGVQTIGYCDVPRGADACAHRQSFDLPGPNSPPVNGASAALVVLVPGSSTVLLVVPRYVDNDTLLWRSDDGGATFSGPVTIATRTGTHGSDYRDAVLGPGNVISMGFANPSVYFQAAPLAGPPGSAELEFPPPASGTLLYDEETAIDNGIPMLAGWNIPRAGRHEVGFYRWSGAGDINSAATWNGPAIVGEGDTTSLVSGPAGVFLFSNGYRTGQDFTSQPQVRKFDGTAFGAPVSYGSTGDDQTDAVEPSAGFLIAASRHQATSGHTVHLEVSRDGGATFAGRDVASALNPFPVRVGAAPDGSGFVAYHDDNALRAVAFDAAEGPPPVLGKSVTVGRESGTVLVKTKGQGFKPLTQDRGIPVGSFVDTRRGVVSLTSAANARGVTQAGTFTAGIFQVLQGRRSRGLTSLRLSGKGFGSCARAGKAVASRRLSRRVIRKLRANAKGRFTTRGRFASATVRGTRWDMTDRCDGTLTRVRRGVVVVDDLRRHRRITVRAGKSYLARAP